MTAATDSPSQPADCSCSISSGHAATRLIIAFSMTISPKSLLFDLPRRPQDRTTLPYLPADPQLAVIASVARAFRTSLRAGKSP